MNQPWAIPDADAALEVGRDFVAALQHQDWERLAASFDATVRFRGLTPRGLREAGERAAAAHYLQKWFGDADELRLVSSEVELMRDRLHIAYRFRAHEDRWYVVEQHVFCSIEAGRVTRMDLLCSGFLPELVQELPSRG